MIELLTSEEMRQADGLAMASGISGIELMENAGRTVADAVTVRHPLGTVVTVLAGTGNNGGDGFVAARVLGERGYRVHLVLAGAADRLRGDAAEAARRYGGTIHPASPGSLPGGGVVIDALFGAGLDRPVEGLQRAVIESVNNSGVPVVAVDLPSGINGDTGAVMGVAIKAAETVTFFRAKPGHLLLPGRLHCGKLRLADIGIPADVLDRIRPNTSLNAPELWTGRFPVPRIDGHKYSRGHAVVLSGGLAKTGAARLAARAALRAGAGLVTIASPHDAVPVHAVANTAVMVHPIDGAGGLASMLEDRRFNAVALGPGGGVGAHMRDCVAASLAGQRAVVLDADALTSFEGDADGLARMIETTGNKAVVATPHQGEFDRLFMKSGYGIGLQSKLDRARTAATKLGAVVVIKGADTVIAAPDGRAAIANNAPPWLATAGSGDVLAGMVTGLLAQGMPPFEAACAAVWLHGEAGNRGGPGLISEDLSELLAEIYRHFWAEWFPDQDLKS